MNRALDVALAVQHEAWEQAVPDLAAKTTLWVRAALTQAWDQLDLPDGPLEVSVMVADDETVRCLNRDWRGKDSPTNVLSFAALDDDDTPVIDGAPVLLGDVVLAFQTCQAEATQQGKSLADHVAHLVVHGTLHLVGFDHEDDEDEAHLMETLETAILAGLGIADPYGDTRDE